MQISSRFTIAVHVLTCIDTFKNEKVTSEFLAASVNVNPVIIRNILRQLKAADIIKVQRGSGGSTIIKPLNEITFYDIYEAVECINNDELFHFHENPNKDCPVGRNIHHALDDKLQQVQIALENELKRITLQDVIDDTKKYIELEKVQ
ncbi:MAG: Rrf2 family transcriptional regulator [Erysipelotrichaceae bacterium]|nr:Rrf2 family transcriptional regulator [Erysipelotrichaceae bacterium]